METIEHYFRIPLKEIEEPEIPLRMNISEESIKELAESIKEIGLLQPIVISMFDGKYKIVAGHRRFKAHKYLQLETIDCKMIDNNEARTELMKYTENFIRLQPSPIDEANYFYNLKESYDLSQKQIAGMINKSEAYVSERLAILNYDDYTKEALKDESITFSVARELVKIKNEDKRRNLVFYAKTNGCSPEQAKSWRLMEEAGEITKKAENGAQEGENKPLEHDLGELYCKCDSCGLAKPMRLLEKMLICPECLQPEDDGADIKYTP